METKVCKCCGNELPLTDFYNNNATKDKHDNTCKECRKKKLTKNHKDSKKPQPGVKATFRLSDFTDDMIFAEIRRRGYTGELRFSKVVAV